MEPEDIKKIRGDLTRKAFAAELLRMSEYYLHFREDVKIHERTIVKYERGERTPNPWQEFLILMYDAKNKNIIYENRFIKHLKENNFNLSLLQENES